MRATAYSLHGRTATGAKPHRGIVAADPRVLPPGSKVQIKNAGRYSGTYNVGDTGGGVHGNKIDIYTPSGRAAQRFGARHVQVKVVKRAPRRK
jgi:3D (Asp-Asp-Asp) domain-containing protein